jgi:uncharacterized membrane protein
MRVQRAPAWVDPPATVRVAVSFAIGAAVAAVVVLAGQGQLAPVIGWDAGAALYLVWIWFTIWPLDSDSTADRARRDDPSKVVADGVLVSASVTSLAAVGLLLIEAADKHGAAKDLYAALGIVSVVIAWAVVHTVFTLRYTSLYYSRDHGGIQFNQDEPPRYSDFAYVAFTIGATFQVSDTDIETNAIRTTVLRHSLLSYLFGAVIVAATINLVAGLGTQ